MAKKSTKARKKATKKAKKTRSARSKKAAADTDTDELTPETTAETQPETIEDPNSEATTETESGSGTKKRRKTTRKKSTKGEATKKKTTRKATKRKSRKKKAASEDADNAVDDSTDKAERPAAKREDAEAESPAAQPDHAQSPKARAASVKPSAPGAEVERDDDSIVIRFPPAAVSPFKPRLVPEAPSSRRESAPTDDQDVDELVPVEASDHPTGAVDEHLADEDEADAFETRAGDFDDDGDDVEYLAEDSEELDLDADDDLTDADYDEPDEDEDEDDDEKPAATRKPAMEDDQEQEETDEEPRAREDANDGGEESDRKRLSASQKRRLRRKRRAQELRDETPRERKPAKRTPETDEDEPEPPRKTAQARRAADHTDTEEEAETEERVSKRRRRGGRRRGRRRDDEAETQETAEPRRTSKSEKPKPAPKVEDEEDDETPLERGKREMIINVVPNEECRIAILEEGALEEIYTERASAENYVGNIYKGIVTNVEPSIQAAFIDFGIGKNGFLHISDLNPSYFPDGGRTENVGRKMPRRNRPPIQRCLRRGQEIVVQVTKEGMGTKGPTLSTYISIPGRFLVMMPGMGRLGVSRKIDDEERRLKLRRQLDALDLPDDIGFIARTAAEDRSKRELQSDLNYLTRLWRRVEQRIRDEKPPAELYRESDLVIRTIRDVFTNDIGRIVVDDADVADRARDFLSIFSPRSSDLVDTYSDPKPVFHAFGIEKELDKLHSRHVPLRSGGSLIIESTEALVAIDVNSGRFRTEDDAETTAYKINIEAADEIARQLRLRDLGGVVVCDFIDMRLEKHKRDIERRLIGHLKKHKERAKVLRMSGFGIIELTRQRQRASLTRSVYQECHHCNGSGLIKSTESVALDVMRLIQLAVTREHIHTIEIAVSLEVASRLQNQKRSLLHELERKYDRVVSIRPEPRFGQDQFEFRCYDQRGRVVPHM